MVTNPRQDDHPRRDTFDYSQIHFVLTVVLARAKLDAADSRYSFLPGYTLIITLERPTAAARMVSFAQQVLTLDC